MEIQTNIVQSKLNAGFFFLCLGILISLITSVVSFLNLVFETLNKRFPDVLNSSYQYGYSTYEYEGIRMALATLIIFFPVFIVISYFWNKFISRGLGRIEEVIKKWLVYIILFLSSLVIVIDLVTLVKYFISGEITTRFILKATVALLVALFVGINYVFMLQGRNRVFGFSVGRWGTIKASILVILAIWFSFSVMGSPAKQRMFRLDDRRVGDLQNMQYQIINYWQQKEKLPKALIDLSNPITGYSLPVPPMFEKGEKYEYTVKSPLTFELCATFDLPIPKGWREYSGYDYGGIMPLATRDKSVSYPYPGGGTNESWNHQAGRACFERTIDKDIYPPYKKQ